MSGSREHHGERGASSHALVTARFELHADSGDAAPAAAELIRRLQEMASLPECGYDLDVSIEWPARRP